MFAAQHVNKIIPVYTVCHLKLCHCLILPSDEFHLHAPRIESYTISHAHVTCFRAHGLNGIREGQKTAKSLESKEKI